MVGTPGVPSGEGRRASAYLLYARAPGRSMVVQMEHLPNSGGQGLTLPDKTNTERTSLAYSSALKPLDEPSIQSYLVKDTTVRRIGGAGRGLRGLMKVALVLALLIVLASAFVADAREYSARRKADGFVVDVAIDRNPPILGNNAIRVEIKDSQGKYVTDAKVAVNYSMPPMPGMPPMNYTIAAERKGDGYRATMNLIMTGPWNIAIKTTTPVKRFTVTVPIDVR